MKKTTGHPLKTNNSVLGETKKKKSLQISVYTCLDPGLTNLHLISIFCVGSGCANGLFGGRLMQSGRVNS